MAHEPAATVFPTARTRIIYAMPILGPLDPAQLVRSARGALVAAARRLRSDHRTIAARSVHFYPTGMGRFYLYAAVAPSRSAARAFDERAGSACLTAFRVCPDRRLT